MIYITLVLLAADSAKILHNPMSYENGMDIEKYIASTKFPQDGWHKRIIWHHTGVHGHVWARDSSEDPHRPGGGQLDGVKLTLSDDDQLLVDMCRVAIRRHAMIQLHFETSMELMRS